MDDIRSEILKRLFTLQDVQYQSFQIKLIPTVSPESVIGVRTGALRKLAKEMHRRADVGTFLSTLPHQYFDENQLHAFIISLGKDYGETLAAVDSFLPYIDNWATCDQLLPTVFHTHHAELSAQLERWMASEHDYTVRFGIVMLMRHFLAEDFQPEHLERVAALRSGAYYVDMAAAWYFATALAKQWDAALPYLEQGRLDAWTHDKAIQKAVESYRVPPERKSYLRTLKIKK